MKKLFATMFIGTLGLGAGLSQAGGPIVIEDTAEVVVEKPASTIGILPILVGVIVLCAVLCNGDEEEPDDPEIIILGQ